MSSSTEATVAMREARISDISMSVRTLSTRRSLSCISASVSAMRKRRGPGQSFACAASVLIWSGVASRPFSLSPSVW